MTIREYAKANGFEIVGKLTRKVHIHEDWKGDKLETTKYVYWVDEAGNEYVKFGDEFVIVSKDGAVF